MDQEDQWRQQRGTLVGVTVAAILAGGIFTFSVVVCGGAAIFAIAIVLGMTALGFLHYFLWGRSLSNEVADERRAVEMRRRLEEEAWPTEEDEPPSFRRF